jgi:hypothetical protein
MVWGDRDCTVSLSSAVNLSRKLRGSELIVVPGGHAVFEETPEQANRIVLVWLDRHPLSTPWRLNKSNAISVAKRSTGAAAVRHLSPEA